MIVSSGISLPLSYKPRIIQGEPNQYLAVNAPAPWSARSSTAMLFMMKDRPLWDRSYLNYIYDIFIELELDGNIISGVVLQNVANRTKQNRLQCVFSTSPSACHHAGIW